MAKHLTNCPACGAALSEHSRETAESYEFWTFACGGQVVMEENGRLEENDPCRDALRIAVEKLNAAKAA